MEEKRIISEEELKQASDAEKCGLIVEIIRGNAEYEGSREYLKECEKHISGY